MTPEPSAVEPSAVEPSAVEPRDHGDDPVDRALLAELREDPDQPVTVLDASGTARSAAERGRRVHAHLDSAAERARRPDHPRITWHDDPADAVRGATVVLARLGKAVAALDDTAQLVVELADPGVELAAAARAKHLRHSMNAVLERGFARVVARRGVGKARALTAAEPRHPGRASGYPLVRPIELPAAGAEPSVTLEAAGHGSVFALGRLDAGTRALLATRDRWPIGGTVVDLGCGSGLLAAVLARTGAADRVLALDDSAAACRSTRRTAELNSVAVEVEHADGLTTVPAGSADLIVCNPPFHQGATKDSTPSMIMLADAGRVLRPGGELWCVWNAHLPYLPWLRRHVGRTDIVDRGRDYLVTRSVR